MLAVFYDKLKTTSFAEQYKRFLERVIVPQFDEDLYVQRIPTFRFHLPGEMFSESFHKDNDPGYNHQVGAVNFWVPLVKSWGTNSLWIERHEGAGPRPIDVDYGQLVVFDAMSLEHGSVPNKTPSTRVSFDFRVIPESVYTETDQVSARMKTPLKIGCYYCTIDEVV